MKKVLTRRLKMDNKENNTPLSGERVYKRYSVALVFTKQLYGSIDTRLRNIICYAESDYEALGYAIKQFEEETKDCGLICKCVIEIDNSNTDARIAELKAENAKLREALENIASATDGNNPGHAVFYFEARKALQGKEAKDE